MNSSISTHALYRICGTKDKAEIDDNRQCYRCKQYGKPEPSDRFLILKWPTGDYRFVRL